ncbi:putative transport permease YfiN [Bacillus sp. J14TS2]|uniref:ABC transporter permease n=1 Tax=Bacillus sp. J14TS2 TaxID=2807188 RepID=UPI001B004232|nr:ABC transporter permease [Bacillus sp. J14TS2]GIN73669.1 putative transport permease YfiN [Bacillus sp. J14TS2]
MIGIIQTRLRLFIRKPWVFILMTMVCVLFSFFIGKSSYHKVTVPVYSELPEQELSVLIDSLNQSELFVFEPTNEKSVKAAIRNGETEAGLHLQEQDFTLMTGAFAENGMLLQRYIQEVYTNKLQKESVLATYSSTDKRDKVDSIWEKALEQPIFHIEKENFRNAESKIMDNQLQSLFGFSLFFVIYTIAFNVIHILEEKQARIWERMTLSSVKKWEMYGGNLLYSFVMGYLQVVLIFSAFRYGAGVDFHGGFGKTLLILIPYVLTIVAMCMLVAALSKRLDQFHGLMSLLAVSLAMLGGAYWPIEIVSTPVILILGKISPLLYGMEALKGVTLYGYGFMEVLRPISILLLMAVIMMGIGINVMEKRRV